MKYFFFVHEDGYRVEAVWGKNLTVDQAAKDAKLSIGKWKLFRVDEDAHLPVTIARI